MLPTYDNEPSSLRPSMHYQCGICRSS